MMTFCKKNKFEIKNKMATVGTSGSALSKFISDHGCIKAHLIGTMTVFETPTTQENLNADRVAIINFIDSHKSLQPNRTLFYTMEQVKTQSGTAWKVKFMTLEDKPLKNK